MSIEGRRPQILQWAKWYVAHKERISYEEIRPMHLGATLPRADDCSATFTNIYYLAGCPDPNGLRFDGHGNTTSLAIHGQQVSAGHCRVGDAVIFYEGGFSPYDSVHVAVIVGDPGTQDPMTMSHGDSAQPSFVTVSQDGRPHRFFRFAVNNRWLT